MTALLRFALAINAALVVLVTVLLWRDPPTPAVAVVPAAPAGSTAVEGSSVSVAPRKPVAEESGTGPGRPEVLAQLEQFGVTPDLLASAVLERFERGWDRRVLELEQQFAPRPVPDRVYLDLARQREEERTSELKSLLGEAGYQAWDRDRTLERLNTTGVPLSVAEADQAYRLQKDFEEKHRELEMAIEDGVADRADGATLQRQAEEALDHALETLLGPARLQAMRGLNDPVAQVYRLYGDMSPTPAQARSVVQVEEEHRAREAELSRQLQANGAEVPDLDTTLATLAQAREQSLRAILGEAAYETHRRESDATYQTLQHFAGAWGLAEQEVQSVYPMLRSFHERAERARSAAALREAAGQSVDWRAVQAGVEHARQQVEAELQQVIGPDRLRRLQQNDLLRVR